MKKKQENILYYALGGGLGHLSRAIAFCQTAQIPKEKLLILTSSGYAKEVLEGYTYLLVPTELENDTKKFQNYLENLLKKQSIQQLYLDSFPCGILGEWTGLNLNSRIKFYYVARLLKWEIYQKQLSNTCLQFDKTFILEKLSFEHQEWIDNNSKKQEKIKLHYPILKPNSLMKNLKSKQLNPIWLIVHSQPTEEVDFLYNYASELADIQGIKPKIIIISKVKLTEKKQVIYINDFPAYPYFEDADRIFTACGFNLMQQTLPFRDKHHFIPFDRKFDNQFERAKRAKLN